MERTVLVFVDLRGVPHRVGRLWSRARRGQEIASFEYDKTWLAHASAFEHDDLVQSLAKRG